MIDTHTHIFCEEFDDDIDSTIVRALAAGVDRMVLPAIDSRSHQRVFSLCDKYPSLCPAIGLHPTSVDKNFKKELEIVESLLTQNRSRIVAIGEVGIDLYWSQEFATEQRKVFETQIDIAINENLPIIVHTRNAYDEVYDTLLPYKSKGIRGVFHSFDQDIDIYKKMSKFDGFYFGVGGVVTFKKSVISRSICEIDLERLVLETDAPYLTPTPFRGKRNEPAYLEYIATAISQIKGVEVDEVKSITHKNASHLFKI